jgi:hypothetical protein
MKIFRAIFQKHSIKINILILLIIFKFIFEDKRYSLNYYESSGNCFLNERVNNNEELFSESSKTIKTKQFNRKDLYHIYIFKNFQTNNAPQGLKSNNNPRCKYKNCYFTSIFNNKTSYDAVLFRKNELKKYIFDLLAINNYNHKIDNIPIMRNRDENQVWILWNNEQKIDRYYDNFLFNWTISYRLDSEIFNCVNGCSRNLKNKDYSKFNESNLRNRFDKNIDIKIKTVYYIDDCKLNNINKNEGFNFAIDLNKIYNLTFISSCYLDFKNQIELEFQEHFIKNDYLFALSFDPFPNCNNYISKKFWYFLKNDLIPIVIHPNKKYYEKNAPLNSYIHVEDFDHDVGKLSDYLKKLEKHFDLYVEYFKWKKSTEIVIDNIDINEKIECEICQKLNEQESEIYYSSVSKWFKDGC